MKIHGKIINGIFSNMPQLYRVFSELDTKDVTVTVTKRQQKRTLPQNAYLWGVVYKTISDFTGYTPEELHYETDDLLQLRMYVDERGIRKVKPTSQMSIEELSLYANKVKLWAWHNLQLHIPDPK